MTTALAAGLTTGTWNLDAIHSEVGFAVRHAGVGKTKGRFSAVTGALIVGESLADSKAEATIAVDSLDTRQEQRDAHVKSADFFDAAQFPEISFSASDIALDGEDLTVTGELTIKGVTRQVTLTGEFNGVGEDQNGDTRAGASLATSISRGDFGLSWNAPLKGGNVLIGDKIAITIEAELVLAK